jgi:hypothetical protein
MSDPDPDEVARYFVTFGKTVESLASEKLLGNLPFEFDAVGTVRGHGFRTAASRFLKKPFSDERLIDCLDRALKDTVANTRQ